MVQSSAESNTLTNPNFVPQIDVITNITGKSQLIVLVRFINETGKHIYLTFRRK